MLSDEGNFFSTHDEVLFLLPQRRGEHKARSQAERVTKGAKECKAQEEAQRLCMLSCTRVRKNKWTNKQAKSSGNFKSHCPMKRDGEALGGEGHPRARSPRRRVVLRRVKAVLPLGGKLTKKEAP